MEGCGVDCSQLTACLISWLWCSFFFRVTPELPGVTGGRIKKRKSTTCQERNLVVEVA